MFRFLETLKLNTTAKLVGGLFYAINPVTLQEFAGGALGGLWEYMLVPPIISYLNGFLSSTKAKTLLKFVGCLALASIFLTHAVIFVVGIPILVFLGTFIGFDKRRSSIFKATCIIISVAVLYPLLLAPTLLPIIGGYASSIAYANNAMPNVQYTYVSASFTNSLRLIAIGWPGAPLQDLGYMTTTPQGLSTWLLPILAIGGCILSLRVKGYSRMVISLLSLIILIAVLDELTKDNLTYSLFRSFPLLYQYESPTKFAYVQSFAYAPAIALLIHRTIEYSRSFRLASARKMLGVFLVALTLSTIAFYSFPFMNGYGGINKVYGQGFYVRDDYFETSSLLSAFRTHSNFFRTLWLPLDYGTYLRSGAVDSYTFSIPGSADIRGPDYPAIVAVKETFDLLAQNHIDAAAEQLGRASVRYVIVDLNSTYRQEPQEVNAYWLIGDPQIFYLRLMNSSSFHFFKMVGSLAIFENLDYLPLFFVTNGGLGANLTAGLIQPVVYVQVGPDRYRVELSAGNSTLLYFAMNFHPDWTAFSGNKILEHQSLGWANVFVVNANDTNVDIMFSGQTERNILLTIQTVSFLVVLAVLLVPARLLSKMSRLFTRPRELDYQRNGRTGFTQNIENKRPSGCSP